VAADIKILSEQAKALENERSQSWDGHYQDVIDYILPHRGRFMSKGDKPNRGDKRMTKIVDSLSTRAMSMLAAGMQGGLTSPSRPWFRLGLNDPTLEGAGQVKAWLSDCERRLYAQLAKSNFYEMAHQLYVEQAGFGTGVMLVLDDPRTVVRFHLLTVGEYCLATGEDGQVDTLHRRLWMTYRQMAQRFGLSSMSQSAQEGYRRSPFEWVQVYHAVSPREERSPGKADGTNMAYQSVYWEAGADKVLNESGYQERPFVAPRWDVVGSDAYGRSPGMIILPDVKMLQEMSKQQLIMIHKVNNPPMAVPVGYKSSLNLTPGGVNYVDPGNQEFVKPLYQIQPDLKDMELKLEQVRGSIKAGLFNDLFLSLNDPQPNMTATEVMERHSEKLLMLGPIVERMQMELLDPCIERVFNIMARAGALAQPPQELAGQTVKVEYTSLLAQAQREISTQSLTRFVAAVQAVAAVRPDAVDKLNSDEIVDQLGSAFGVQPAVIVPTDEVQQVRQARAQAQAQAQMAEQQRMQTESAAQALQQVGSIPTGEGTLAGDAMADAGGM
jgi:hypothetical protein